MSSKQQQTEIRHISLQVITCEVEPYGLVLDSSTDDEGGIADGVDGSCSNRRRNV